MNRELNNRAEIFRARGSGDTGFICIDREMKLVVAAGGVSSVDCVLLCLAVSSLDLVLVPQLEV